jgi:hypothetical protein
MRRELPWPPRDGRDGLEEKYRRPTFAMDGEHERRERDRALLEAPVHGLFAARGSRQPLRDEPKSPPPSGTVLVLRPHRRDLMGTDAPVNERRFDGEERGGAPGAPSNDLLHGVSKTLGCHGDGYV